METDPIKQEKLEALKRFRKAQSMKQAAKLFSSVAILYFLAHFCQPLPAYVDHLQHILPLASTIYVEASGKWAYIDYLRHILSSASTIFTEANSKWVALLCSSILVVAAVDSGLFSFSSTRGAATRLDKSPGEKRGHCKTSEDTVSSLESLKVLEIGLAAEGQDGDEVYYDAKEYEEGEKMVARGCKQEEEVIPKSYKQLVLTVGVTDLNQKCDEFIEKMRRRMKMENMQLLFHS